MSSKLLYIIISVMFVINIFLIFGLVYKEKKMLLITEYCLKIERDVVNCQNIAKNVMEINENNMKQTYSPLILSNELLKQEIEKSVAPKIYVRFKMNFCGSCLNEMYIYLKEIGESVGVENIVLLPICESEKEYVFFKQKFGHDFPFFDVKSNEFSLQNIPDPVKPYFFVFGRNLENPLLFFAFNNEFSELNDQYRNVLLDFFTNYNKGKTVFN